MILNSLSFEAGGQCTLSLEPADGWLCTTWSGYVTPADAKSGALDYLEQARHFPSHYLLNDNTNLQGPWFSSLQWLERVWLPQAIHLGLRYIAHVVQEDMHNDILTLICSVPTPDVFELQLFDDKASAQEWLQECQDQ
jgi:hypothetical protein